jgi:hypothetical protein
MLAGQVGLRRNATDWLGKTIEWFTDSDTHHCVIAINDTQCVSADRPHVIIRDILEYPNLDWSSFTFEEGQSEAVVFSAMNMVGRPYNMAAVVFIGISRLTRVPIPQFIRNWLRNRPNVSCSQLASVVLEISGIDLFEHDDSLITPDHFRDYFEAQGWLVPQTGKIEVRNPATAANSPGQWQPLLGVATWIRLLHSNLPGQRWLASLGDTFQATPRGTRLVMLEESSASGKVSLESCPSTSTSSEETT